MTTIENRDINDVFEDILLAEENSSHQGYQEGFDKGVNAGNSEGYHLGYHRGAELGSELGFYYGVVETFLCEKSKLSEKQVLNLEILKKSIEEFPRSNDENIDILHLASEIRRNYKKVCSLLKKQIKYPFGDELTF